MRALAFGIPALLAGSCMTRPPVALEAPEAVIHASPWNRAAAVASLEIVDGYLPVVQGILGATCERPIIVLLDLELLGDTAASTSCGRSGPEVIRVGRRGQAALRPVLVHELVHWVAFGSVWGRLPISLHQGLAYLLQVQLVEALGKTLTIPAPCDEELQLLLGSSGESDDEASYGAAAWFVGKVGLRRLRGLAERAERDGLERVPADWLAQALPEPWDGAAELGPLQLVEACFLDERGVLLGSAIVSVPGVAPAMPPGTAGMEMRSFELPAYDGPTIVVDQPQSRSENGVKSVP